MESQTSHWGQSNWKVLLTYVKAWTGTICAVMSTFFAFDRRFYPNCISRDTFTLLSVLAFPGNRTHDLGVASSTVW